MLIDNVLKTVNERQQNYNHPSKNFDDIAKMWSVIVGKEITKEQVALMMIALKILRENFKHQDDNLVDIYGYTLCLEMLNENR